MHPNVYWAQTAKDVFLKVAIIDIQREPDICIEDEEIEFCAIGSTGTQGIQRYDFVIEFFLPIDASTSSFVIREREIMISLPKKETDWWPRLLHEPKKLPWLKVDFEKWKSEDLSSTDDENPKDEIKKRLSDQVSSEDFLRSKYPDVYKDLQKHELNYVSESNRKIYLFFYNLFMFCTYLYIFSVLNIRYARLGNDFIPHAFKSVGSVLKMISLLMFLEVLHPIFGYTKTSSLNAFLTIGSRNFILFFLIDGEPRIQEKPVIFYTFTIYCLIELTKYPYYLLRTYDIQQGFIAWIRYTLWIPLYPATFICEGVIVLRNIPYFEETKKFTVSLPNSYNFAFHFPSVLRIYLLFVFFPTLYASMQAMYQQRCKKLNVKQYKKNKKGFFT
nr:LOW QUALITY PROTEIN: very-long-chain (3R)-3-hydroxyacyl-CoA dehydratase-like [Lepeophtheirus salmonis]